MTDMRWNDRRMELSKFSDIAIATSFYPKPNPSLIVENKTGISFYFLVSLFDLVSYHSGMRLLQRYCLIFKTGILTAIRLLEAAKQKYSWVLWSKSNIEAWKKWKGQSKEIKQKWKEPTILIFGSRYLRLDQVKFVEDSL